MSLGTTYSPTVPVGGATSYKFDHCLHIVMVIWKCTDVFRGIFRSGGGGGLRREEYAGGTMKK